MIELPETYVLAEQINKTLAGKTIKSAVANGVPHGFAWFTGDPAEYPSKLNGKKIECAKPGTGYTCGGNTEVYCMEWLLAINTPIKYHAPGEKLPKSHQLLLELEDGSHMSCTVQMYGGMLLFPLSEGRPESFKWNDKPDPYTNEFNEVYFDGLRRGVKQNISVKAFLATEQRIPGFGNGVLHDTIFNARIHPKRKMETLADKDMENLYKSLKSTLFAMRDGGGRDTERDLFGKPGGYQTILSNKTLASPCRVCGGGLVREAYMGGNIYFCPTCQKI
ncbi:MAG: endonuclease VIII [Defluviitaleaceae bacterium]|nr:endonuclease VIII [Defluviitaleaceae bacterium]